MKRFNLKRLVALLVVLVTIMMASCVKEMPNDPTSPNEVKSTVITLEQAKEELGNLLSEMALLGAPSNYSASNTKRIARGYTLTPDPALYTSSEADSVIIFGEVEHMPVHVFNFEDDGGFAIMSTDIRLPSLFAITESGSLNPGDTIVNPGFGIFLESLGDYLSGVFDTNNPPEVSSYAAYNYDRDIKMIINIRR